MLKGLIAAKAAERVTPADLERLRGHADRLTAAVTERVPLRYSTSDRDLHETLAEIASQATASDLIGRLGTRLLHFQFQLSLRPGRPQASLGEHLVVIEAVLARDPHAAAQAMHDHLDSVIAAIGELG